MYPNYVQIDRALALQFGITPNDIANTQVMPDTMTPLTAAAIEVPLRDQRRRFSRIIQRDRVRKRAADTALARLAKDLTLVLAVNAGISAAPGSGLRQRKPDQRFGHAVDTY